MRGAVQELRSARHVRRPQRLNTSRCAWDTRSVQQLAFWQRFTINNSRHVFMNVIERIMLAEHQRIQLHVFNSIVTVLS